MFDSISRPSSAQRLANQMRRLDTGPQPDCTMGDLSVGDVFSSQVDAEMEMEVPQNGDKPLAAPHNQQNGIPTQGRPGFPATGAPTPLLHGKATAGKKKKKHLRRMADVEVGHSTPALSTVRGFTPMPSGDEDSDLSAAGSRTMSPQLNAVPTTNTSGGISALKLQLDALNLSESHLPRVAEPKAFILSSNASVSSDSDRTEVMTSYEVPLENDFISNEAVAEEESVLFPSSIDIQNDLCRKMTSRDFEQLMCLGKGTFGTVLLVRHRATGRLYAQKQFRKASITVHKKLVEQTKTERMILESVNRHPFVVKLYYAFQDHEKLYLILEYAQGGELFTHLAAERMFSEDVAAFYMAEMVLALEHLHKTVGVVYRDLKPENCLLDSDGHLLLTDFGLSKVAVSEDDRCNSSLGTIEYMAPEVIQGKPYGKACDWWSLGALGYDLLTGSPPFKANNHAKIQEKIVRQKLTLPYYLGPDAKDLLIRLLRKDPHKRLGYHMPKDLETIKKHRFFRKIDWKALARRELDAPIQPVITDPALAENFSADFTSIPLSPVSMDDDRISDMLKQVGLSSESNAGVNDADPFRGFSFVASSSLLNSGFGLAT
ncbi:putative serine/threonine protein kinase [Talaromyces proteolyticus]|uniref:Serine/threonine protein kinase n=1 Tax=Talaromyces proteolyticus TaxID=1131652 RepID=A0AAD4KNC3_9EURO|nr:putative serine/threonine protein kinase [Talaromyces proteolyticus]KAH8695364.1 putative serine/threonine protein kinase [Talaromyces proteolyticus]